MMTIEKDMIAAMKRVLPDFEFYHDFAPDNARLPFAVLQRAGGAGALALEHDAPLRETRLQTAWWCGSRGQALEAAAAAEKAVCKALACYADGAAVSVFDAQVPAYGARLDFMVYTSEAE